VPIAIKQFYSRYVLEARRIVDQTDLSPQAAKDFSTVIRVGHSQRSSGACLWPTSGWTTHSELFSTSAHMGVYSANPDARAALIGWNVARAQIGPNKLKKTGQC
jgi:hypothetical protein